MNTLAEDGLRVLDRIFQIMSNTGGRPTKTLTIPMIASVDIFMFSCRL